MGGISGPSGNQSGFTGSAWQPQRIANVFKNVIVSAAGDTDIWTPASGKKFRLMGGFISASGTAAALTADLFKLLDGSAGTVFIEGFIAVDVTVSGDAQIFFDFGQGRLSGAVNTKLVANLVTAFATGGIAMNVWGTEE